MGFLEIEDKISFNKSYNEVYGIVIDCIKELGWALKENNKATGRIVCSTGINLVTLGEKIHIKVERDNKKTSVSIISAPKTGPALGGLFSTGRSRNHISKLFTLLGGKLK